MPSTIRAVFWDFGGVILSSPFHAFTEYERTHGLPENFLRTVNTVNPDDNAWARIERQEITAAEFDAEFAEESEQLGHRVPGADVLALLEGELRSEMIDLLDRVIAAGYDTACLTNNVVSEMRPDVQAVMDRFGFVLESSKAGVRKPELAFYEMACAQAQVDPSEVVFLDDLGINLKPARAMGMTTIKVVDPQQAITDLEALLQL